MLSGLFGVCFIEVYSKDQKVFEKNILVFEIGKWRGKR